MLKKLIQTPLNLPAVAVKESISVIGTILNHSSTMKQISCDYKLAKGQMDYAYDIEIKKIEKEVLAFERMINSYRQNSQNQHIERMDILNKSFELSLKILDIEDIKKCEILNKQVENLLNIYERNNQENRAYLENSSIFGDTTKLLN